MEKKKKRIHCSLRREDQNPRNGELQNMACVIETYTDELLFTNIGRRSLKVSKVTAIRYACIFIVREMRADQTTFTYDFLLRIVDCIRLSGSCVRLGIK